VKRVTPTAAVLYLLMAFVGVQLGRVVGWHMALSGWDAPAAATPTDLAAEDYVFRVQDLPATDELFVVHGDGSLSDLDTLTLGPPTTADLGAVVLRVRNADNTVGVLVIGGDGEISPALYLPILNVGPYRPEASR
jgi:hypothetical protein